jgi:hypothetical protein
MFAQSGWADWGAGGFVGLNGGSGASFDDFSVSKVDGTYSASDDFTMLPAAATGLVATAISATQIDLSWSAAVGADGYAIERSPDGTTGWTRVGTTPSGASAFRDTGLDASTAYYYRVLATNTAGTSSPGDVAGATTPPVIGDVLFGDAFGPSWGTVGGSWVQRDGVLSQSATQSGDPQKAMVVDRAFSGDVEVSARVRVDTWAGGDWARAGVSLAQSAEGLGYNLVFRDGGVQFLDDHVAWGNFYAFEWRAGAWYHFKLRSSGGVLEGKVWGDGAAEPSGWMFAQSGWTGRAGGHAGLNGGSGASTASFDDLVVMGVTATSTG